MTIGKWILLLMLPLHAHGIGANNGYVPVARGKVSAAELRAMMTALDSAQCIYGNLGDRTAALEWDPEVYDIPVSCGSKEEKPEQRAMCVGTVICHSPAMDFIVEKATCWARDSIHCPPPSKCAQQSFIKSFDSFRAIEKMPVYMTTEPAGVTK